MRALGAVDGLLSSTFRADIGGKCSSRYRTANTIRIEVKLHTKFLKARNLEFVSRWRSVNVEDIFFDVLSTYDVTNSVQPLPSAELLGKLSKAQHRACSLWLGGEDLCDSYSRTTVWKYKKEIQALIGIDVTAAKRPELAPLVDLRMVLVRDNIMPVPEWAFDSPYYSKSMDEEFRLPLARNL